MNRLIRLIIVALVSFFGGLLIWMVTGNIANNFGDLVASIWFITCIVIAGYGIHKLLPAADNSDLYLEDMFSVSFDEQEVICISPDGNKKSLNWSDLEAVKIITSDSGPWVVDVIWCLHTASDNLAFPQGAKGDEAFLNRLQKLPNFNDEEVIKAMGCTNNKEFLVWTK